MGWSAMTELAQGVLSLSVALDEPGRDIGKWFQRMQGDAGRAGKQAGVALSSGVRDGTEKAKADLAKLNQAMALSGKAAVAARSKQEDATRKLGVAEAKLNELRESGKAKQSQILAAEDRLESARKQVSKATLDAAAAQKKYRDATEQASQSAKLQAASTTSQVSGLGRLREAFTRTGREASKAGAKAGAGFSDEMGKSAAKASRRGGSAFSGALIGGIVGGPIGMAVAGAAQQLGSSLWEGISGGTALAADLEQSTGAVDAIFKKSASQVHKWAEASAESLYLTENSYNKLAVLIGAQLKNGGTSIDQLGTKTNDLIKVGADLSAQFGGSTEDAVSALSSALKGERDPIERYGVSLKQASIDAKAAALGFEKVGGSFSNEAQQAATLALIMEQTKDAHGALGRETDTASAKQAKLAAVQEELKTKFGEVLLPMKTMATETGLRLASWAEGMVPKFQGMVGGLQRARVAAVAFFRGLSQSAAGGAVSAFVGDAQKRLSGWAVSAVSAFREVKQQLVDGWTLGPSLVAEGGVETVFTRIGDAVANAQGDVDQFFRSLRAGGDNAWILESLAGVGRWLREGLGGALAWVTEKFGVFRDVVAREVGPPLMSLFDRFATGLATVRRVATEFASGMLARLRLMAPQFRAVFGEVGAVVKSVFGLIGAVVTRAMQVVGAVVKVGLDVVRVTVTVATKIIAGIWDRWGNQIMGTVAWIWQTVLAILKPALQMVRGVIQFATGLIQGDWSKAWGGVKTVLAGAWGVIKAIFVQLWKGIQGIWGTVTSFLGRQWSNTWAVVRAGFDSFVGSIMKSINGFRGRITAAFDAIVSGVRSAWSAVQNAVSSPINFVISVINGGVIDSFNKIAEKLGVSKRLDRIPAFTPPSTPSNVVSKGGSRKSSAYSAGGILPGYTPGKDVHRFYSPTAGLLDLSGGEAILRPEFSRIVGASGVDMLNTAARRGGRALKAAFGSLGHMAFKSGGLVSFRGKTFTAEFARRLAVVEKLAGRAMQITQGGFRPQTSYSGTSHRGDALDIAGGGHQYFIPFLRAVGIPTWDRTGKGNWISHSHGVPLPGAGTAGGSAVWQAQDYLRGGDGLGGRDNGPRPAQIDTSKVRLSEADIAALQSSAEAGGGAPWFVELFQAVTSTISKAREVVSQGAFGEIAAAFAKSSAETIKDSALNVLGFQSGGVMPRTGLAALSEDGRPELVVGPQMRQLMAGSKVYSFSETQKMLGGGGAPRIYVQNPWTGEYMEARMVSTAQDVFDDNAAALQRRGAFA